MRIAAVLIAIALFFAAPASAQQHRAGEFDYYVMALSWSPSWCRSTGDQRNAAQCDPGGKVDFVLHGLWPQYEEGWPENCRTDERDPSRRETQAMADIMSSGGLAWYQWQKHGRCSGLSAADYYQISREAFRSVTLPDYFVDLDRDISIPPELIEEAFIEFNPELTADGITVTCRNEDLQEIRICLTRDLQPRDCAPDVRRDCSRNSVIMEKVR
ncbi:ribonuclease T2 [Paracoccus aerodenitrificans]|uniref:ribonuclease T2 n=1 Tax=Paracoccus aerodenitrificans TaxID=3017781 RepID=UPI0022F024F2|nr:ribonuclease T2 [Paracoccus aerodenitrificans]WBU64505.1 ribonuclease T2 [Paracoccus aerodenitrificans]